MVKLVNILLEYIKPEEAYDDEDSLQTVIDRRRDVGVLGNHYSFLRDKIEKEGLLIKKVEKNPQGLYIVYRPGSEKKVERLEKIANKYGGYLSYKATPEETREIGGLLSYDPEEVEKYIKSKYSIE